MPNLGGVKLGEYIPKALDKLQLQKVVPTIGITPFSRINPAMRSKPSIPTRRVRPESVEGLLPGTDEGKQKVSGVARIKNIETRPSSPNSVANCVDVREYNSLAIAYVIILATRITT